MCTLAFRPSKAADSDNTSADSYDATVAVRPYLTRSGACHGKRASMNSMGATMPALLSAMPSSTKATPRKVAPDFRAAIATGTAPWPYPSAFTTAMICVLPGMAALTRSIFPAILPVSTSTQVGRIPGR